MKRMCAWCGRNMGTTPSSSGPETIITHVIYESCAARFFDEMAADLMTFLDRLSEPVVMVDPAGIVKTANRHAHALLQKDLPKIAGRASVDVGECVHAKLPEGCGNTVHCRECTIRNTVMDTFQSGRCHLNTPARLNNGTLDATNHIDLLISTEKVGDIVLLRIDTAADPDGI